MLRCLLFALTCTLTISAQPAPAPMPGPAKGLPPIVPKAEELQLIEGKAKELEGLVRALPKTDAALVTDVEVYAKAGRFLLEFPQTFFTQDGIRQAIAVLDQGLGRARQLQKGSADWATAKGRKIHAYRSALDGSVQPYGLTVPESYDGTKPTRLYVWLHGRDQTLTESSFIYKFPNANKSLTYSTADLGQITLDCYGRWNNANHWAGEVDIFEAIADVSRRYKIDPKRIILRGFSLGGAGAWHIALQYPDRWAAAEIGAGTYPRRSQMPGFPPYQAGPLRIWENILDWSLNAFNLPLAGHDGDSDTQTAVIPQEPGKPSRGQLESSLRVRAQLEKEGLASEGEENNWRVKGTRDIFLISEKTGHGVSPLVRQRLDAFLKEHGDRGVVSPDEVRFVTYTTRYPRAHWVSLDGLAQHYERAEVQARRDAARQRYEITTRNVTHLELREMEKMQEIKIDGQTLRAKAAPQLLLYRTGGKWRIGDPRACASAMVNKAPLMMHSSSLSCWCVPPALPGMPRPMSKRCGCSRASIACMPVTIARTRASRTIRMLPRRTLPSTTSPFSATPAVTAGSRSYKASCLSPGAVIPLAWARRLTPPRGICRRSFIPILWGPIFWRPNVTSSSTPDSPSMSASITATTACRSWATWRSSKCSQGQRRRRSPSLRCSMSAGVCPGELSRDSTTVSQYFQ